MRPVIIAANWKMNTTPADAGRLAVTIAAASQAPGVVRVICPPYLSLAAVRDAVTGEGIDVGAQNVHHELAGAYTGEISAPMLAGLATWVILGHSERRRDALEIRCAHQPEARPRARERPPPDRLRRRAARGPGCGQGRGRRRRAGARLSRRPRTRRRSPTAGSSSRTSPSGRSGPGGPRARPTPRRCPRRSVVSSPRSRSPELAAAVPVLYGGSVTSANIAEFLAEPSIDGALVGGASLKPDEMAGSSVRRASLRRLARLPAPDDRGRGDGS